MAKPIAHKIVPTRIVAEIDGEDTTLATLDLRIPVHATPGEKYTNEDGNEFIRVTPYLKGDAIEKALKKVLRGKTNVA